MDDLKEIKAKELKNNMINDRDIDSIKDLAKALKIKHKLSVIILSYAVFITGIISISNLVSLIESEITLNMDLVGAFVMLGVCIFLSYVLYDIMRDIKFLKTSNPQKSQYGVVKEKYIITETNEGSTSTSYYVDILFEENNTFIKKVETSRIIYHSLKNRDAVLVVSFNGKNSYCLKTNSI